MRTSKLPISNLSMHSNQHKFTNRESYNYHNHGMRTSKAWVVDDDGKRTNNQG